MGEVRNYHSRCVHYFCYSLVLIFSIKRKNNEFILCLLEYNSSRTIYKSVIDSSLPTRAPTLYLNSKVDLIRFLHLLFLNNSLRSTNTYLFVWFAMRWQRCRVTLRRAIKTLPLMILVLFSTGKRSLYPYSTRWLDERGRAILMRMAAGLHLTGGRERECHTSGMTGWKYWR